MVFFFVRTRVEMLFAIHSMVVAKIIFSVNSFFFENDVHDFASKKLNHDQYFMHLKVWVECK